LAPLVALTFVVPVRADLRVQSTLRELASQARLVVRAVPLGAASPNGVRVTEVLLGGGARAGESIVFETAALQDGELRDILKAKEAPAARVFELVMFLQATDVGGKKHWWPLPSGLRSLRNDGVVFGPEVNEHLKDAIPTPAILSARKMVPCPDLRWTDLLLLVQEDCAALRALAARRAITSHAARNRAILAWMEEHRHELNTDDGWGDLENDLFNEVLATATIEDGWAAVQLYAQVHNNVVPRLRRPIFGGTAGRQFLLRTATADHRLVGDRARALRLLSDTSTLWPVPDASGRTAETDKKEQQEIADQLLSMLKHPSVDFRCEVARALLAVSQPPDHVPDRRMALPVGALTDAYKSASPGPARNELAALLRQASSAEHWQEVTGNPHRALVRLQDFTWELPKMSFWLQMDSAGATVYEAPVVVLEQLNGDKVVQKKERPAAADLLGKAWATGWSGRPLLIEFGEVSLQPGSYRITVKGTVGKNKDRVAWTSEPQVFVVTPPRGPIGPYVSGTWDW
jgi:hypothetical protein